MNQLLFLDKIFGVLFTLFLVIFLLGWALRLAAPYLLKFAAKRIQKKFENQFNNNTSSFFEENTPPQPPKEKKKVGEYVDFEELD